MKLCACHCYFNTFKRTLTYIIFLYLLCVVINLLSHHQLSHFDNSQLYEKVVGKRKVLQARDSTGKGDAIKYTYNAKYQNQSDMAKSSLDDNTDPPVQQREYGGNSKTKEKSIEKVKSITITKNVMMHGTAPMIPPEKKTVIDRKMVTNMTFDNTIVVTGTTLNPMRDLTIICSGTYAAPRDMKAWHNALISLSHGFEFEDVPFHIYSLNATLSQSLPLFRPVPETRHGECRTTRHTHFLPSVSIVMPFHNEQYSLLLRSLHSILDKTPLNLIQEVILIDDASTLPNLRAPLEAYLKHLPRVILFRTKQREGLIRARMLGALVAKAKILVFLDAHIECQQNWLQPLIEVVLANNSTIAIPAIDKIDPVSMQYLNSDKLVKVDSRGVTGIFDWELNYVWKMETYPDVNQSPWQPVPSATIIGCAMAMNRESFFRMGAFDEDMYIWGGENLEISFKTWMCGGSIKLVPCSKLAHLFRRKLPYKFPNGEKVQMNLQRLAEVWMDDYRHLFYQTTGRQVPFTPSQHASLQKRQQLRKLLKCHSFQWYLDTLGLSLPLPLADDKYFGQLLSVSHFSCLTLKNEELGFFDCMYNVHEQHFHLSRQGHLRHHGGQCVTYDQQTLSVVMHDCEEANSLQLWHFSNGGQTETRVINGARQQPGLLRLAQGMHKYCFSIVQDYISPNGDAHYSPCLQSCLQHSNDLLWSFTHHIYQ